MNFCPVYEDVQCSALFYLYNDVCTLMYLHQYLYTDILTLTLVKNLNDNNINILYFLE